MASKLKFPITYAIVLCGCGLFLTFIAPMAMALDAEGILEKVKPSIVAILKETRRIGSGCIVSSDGFVLTDSSAMQAGNDARNAQVQFSDGTIASAGLIAIDERLNIALLTVNTSKNLKSVALGNSNAVRKNEQVVIIGAPISLKTPPANERGITFLYGTVTHNKRLREPPPNPLIGGKGGEGIFQIASEFFHPVHTGAPVLNPEGAVIGIIIGKIYPKPGDFGYEDNVGFAIPINPVKVFLEKHGVKYQEPADLVVTTNLLKEENLFIVILFGIPAVGLIVVILVAFGGRGKAKSRVAKLHNPKTGEYHLLSSSDVTIGRSSKNAIIISDETVSRQHAFILSRAGKYIIRNVSTTNHTYVNGNQIEQCELQNGDKISMGNTTLIFLSS